MTAISENAIKKYLEVVSITNATNEKELEEINKKIAIFSEITGRPSKPESLMALVFIGELSIENSFLLNTGEELMKWFACKSKSEEKKEIAKRYLKHIREIKSLRKARHNMRINLTNDF